MIPQDELPGRGFPAIVTPVLQPGDVCPDFALVAHDGRLVRLAEELGEGPVVLCFYVMDRTPG